MTKVRQPGDIVVPPDPPVARCVPPRGLSVQPDREHLGVYSLRPTSSVPVLCTDVPEEQKLRELIAGNRFGAAYPPTLAEIAKVTRLFAPSGAQTFWPAVSLRYDRHLGLAFTTRGLDLREVYIVPKVNLSFEREISFEALLTQTASQFFSSYLSLGAAREKFDDDFEWNYVTETGLRFRFRTPGWVRIITLGHDFGGFRFGIRASGFDMLRKGRIVVEAGAGTW
ncbi:MAG: hypothetical protein GF331_21125 [Chitinivibrionales bacterium]|nr:hypothetical protein [Chitinivibrionales bacterium]